MTVKMDWLPITDNIKDGRRVIIGVENDEPCTAEFTNGRWVVSPTAWDGDGENGGLQDAPFEPTHYMPLPPPPRKG